METEKDINLYINTNTNNEESYFDNQSSYYETSGRNENIGNYDNFTSNDINNYCDFKYKPDINSESKYSNLNKDPK